MQGDADILPQRSDDPFGDPVELSGLRIGQDQNALDRERS
jgi:hypothetical protein